ncbi:MAG: thioredoxin domain-containing protein [Acidobacteriota bacterium]
MNSLLFLLPLSVMSQSPRRGTGRRPVTPKPAVVVPAAVPSPAPSPAREPQPPAALAVINGQTITTADIDQRVRQEVEKLPDAIAEARSQTLDLQVNTALLQAEAAKRKLTTQQLYNSEVANRVTNPTPADIQEFIDANRDQLGEGSEVEIRKQVTALLRASLEAKIQQEFVQRLRKANPVTMGVDVNSPNLAPTAVLATVGGRPITAGIIIERLKSTIYKLQYSAYDLEREALNRTINDLLLIAEANRRSVPPEEIVRTEVTEKAHVPTDAELEKFYAENKSQITGDLNSVRSRLTEFLQEQERQRLEQAMNDRLRKGANIRLLLAEPQAPVQAISVDDDPSRGDPNAPVTIVEFSDFQCPSCAAMHPILEEVLKSYGNKVRFVMRDFPLAMHANARKAAEAANAANAQGKFFEYAALLFQRQKALDVPSLKKYATELGLDRARFDAALDNGSFAAEVRHDVEDGEIYGIDRTPTIFINGASLQTLSAEALRALIDRALATTKAPPE